MKQTRPNILLITSDQQRYDTMGDLAPSFMRTPHFDTLCNRGVVFTSAYADCPKCVPARVSIMSGKYATTHKMCENKETSLVLGKEKTLPALLKKCGYQTAGIGKMHFGPERTRHGFDEMILPADYFNYMNRSGFPLKPMRHGLGQGELYPGMSTVPESLTLTSWIAEQCVEYIHERRDPSLPFFLWCSFTKPHPPLDPPEPYYSMYRNCPIPDPVFGDWTRGDGCPEAVRRRWMQLCSDKIPKEVIKEARAAYYGLITQNDYNMGRVFGSLQDLQMFNETLIIYTSDHGEYLGDHFLGGKSFSHEAAAHVPFAMKLPKSWQDSCHGKKISLPITHADILPTLLNVAKGELPDDIDGQDLMALAQGRLKNPRQHIDGVSGGPVDSCMASIYITDGHWKYIWFPEGGKEQLFDLDNDHNEIRNLSFDDKLSDKLNELKSELIKRHENNDLGYVRNGFLVTTPVISGTERDYRRRSYGTLITERYSQDIKH